MIDEILSKFGLKYEDLNSAEKETLHQWLDLLSSKKLSLDDVKANIRQMKESVEKELTEIPSGWFTWLLGWRRDFILKARLRNYMLLEAFLESPDKAKQALENMLARLGKRG